MVVHRRVMYRNDTINQKTINSVRNKFGINRKNKSFQAKNLMLLNKEFFRQLQRNLNPNPSDMNVRLFKYNNISDPLLQNKIRVFVLTSPIRWKALKAILGSANTRTKIENNLLRGRIKIENKLLRGAIDRAMQDIFNVQPGNVSEENFNKYMRLRAIQNNVTKRLDNRYQKAYLNTPTNNTPYLNLFPKQIPTGNGTVASGNVLNIETVSKPKSSNSPRHTSRSASSPRRLRTR